MSAVRNRAWIGVDIGKTHHWVCAVDETGNKLLSLKVLNDEAQILEGIAAVDEVAAERVWAIDILGTPSALLVALLGRAGEQMRYASGRVVAAMSTAYTREGKTDAKDAYVIAETARIRTDLRRIDADTDLVRTLGLLTGHRSDLVADRVRMINRLRDLLTSVFPALEREFDSSCKGALVLLSGYATPTAIRRMGEARLSRWLRQPRVCGYADVATRAVAAAQTHQTTLAGEEVAAGIVAELAEVLLAQHDRLKLLDQQIQDAFVQHPQAEVIVSIPGFGSVLGDSWSRLATCPHSPRLDTSLPPRDWSRSQTTPDGA